MVANVVDFFWDLWVKTMRMHVQWWCTPGWSACTGRRSAEWCEQTLGPTEETLEATQVQQLHTAPPGDRMRRSREIHPSPTSSSWTSLIYIHLILLIKISLKLSLSKMINSKNFLKVPRSRYQDLIVFLVVNKRWKKGKKTWWLLWPPGPRAPRFNSTSYSSLTHNCTRPDALSALTLFICYQEHTIILLFGHLFFYGVWTVHLKFGIEMTRFHPIQIGKWGVDTGSNCSLIMNLSVLGFSPDFLPAPRTFLPSPSTGFLLPASPEHLRPGQPPLTAMECVQHA